MERVLILGMYRFPHGDAPSNRLLAMAKSIQAAGFSPFVIGNGQPAPGDFDPEKAVHITEGVPYTSVRAQRDNLLSRIIRRMFLTWFLARAVQHEGLADVHCIVTTHGTITLGLLLLCKFVWRKPLVVDCVEWFEPHQFRFGRMSSGYIGFRYKFGLLCSRVRNVIGVSTFLTAHFSRTAHATLCIPPQIDLDSFALHENVGDLERIELFYAGTAAGKDHLGTALAGLLMLRPSEIARIRFTIAGPSSDQVAALLPEGQKSVAALGGALRLLGRISRADVLSELSRMHFTVLLRPVTLNSTAGFPSKIPESLAAGTPVMVNLTSDLGDYLTDGEDSLIVEDCTPEAFATALRRSLQLSSSDLNRMISSARRCAHEAFDYRVWTEPVGDFIRRAS